MVALIVLDYPAYGRTEDCMNLGTMLHEQLKKLDAGNNAVAVAAGSNHALLNIVDSDRYSVTMRDLTVGGMPRHSSVPTFLDVATSALIHELQYLEEPLARIELDATEGQAILRSTQPQREGETLSYWEVTLDAGVAPSAKIARYSWSPGMIEREPVAYPATFRLLARITDSMETALASAL